MISPQEKLLAIAKELEARFGYSWWASPNNLSILFTDLDVRVSWDASHKWFDIRPDAQPYKWFRTTKYPLGVVQFLIIRSYERGRVI